MASDKLNMTSPSSSTLNEILVLGPPTLYKVYKSQLSSNFNLLKPFESPLPLNQFLTAHAQTTQAALCGGEFKVKAEILRQLPSLRLLVTTSAGLDHIDLVECHRLNISVANVPSLFSAHVADLAVGLLLDVLRRISGGDRFVRGGLWPGNGGATFPLGVRLSRKRVGIVGLGSIGREVAKRLKGFGCITSYNSRKEKPSVPYLFQSNIHELATTSDILIICCALNKETFHMINRDVLLALGKDGVIVNIARGAVIDEKELVRSLQQRDIAGAGLDVFENEPHIPKELFELDNVVLSPHAAVFTEESFRDMYELVLGNLEAFFSNRPLLSKVSLEQIH